MLKLFYIKSENRQIYLFSRQIDDWRKGLRSAENFKMPNPLEHIL